MRFFYTQLFVFLFTCQFCMSATHDRINVLNTFKAWCDHKQIPKLPSTSILLEEPEYFLFSPASKVQKAMQEWDSTYPETGYMIQFCFREKWKKGVIHQVNVYLTL